MRKHEKYTIFTTGLSIECDHPGCDWWKEHEETRLSLDELVLDCMLHSRIHHTGDPEATE